MYMLIIRQSESIHATAELRKNSSSFGPYMVYEECYEVVYTLWCFYSTFVEIVQLNPLKFGEIPTNSLCSMQS